MRLFETVLPATESVAKYVPAGMLPAGVHTAR
jgi:hypothetical protein